jgi:hypothetical protein
MTSVLAGRVAARLDLMVMPPHFGEYPWPMRHHLSSMAWDVNTSQSCQMEGTTMPYTHFGKLNGDADLIILVCVECFALVPKLRDQEHEQWHAKLKESVADR